jgi:3-hydroxyisobutyrate dehydrogenase-like beta-hydroxyacid dehydrogenase
MSRSIFMSGMEHPPAEPTEASDANPAVGFAGLGRMGQPMVQRLIQSHLPIVSWDRTQAKAEALVASGARWVAAPRDLAKSIGKGVTFLMVSDGQAVKSVLFGRSGFARGAPAGALVVNTSTVDPDESRTFAARLSERGIHYVDAPVAGSVDQAEKGEIVFFAGGDLPDIARARPLLERMGRAVEYMGPVGAGNATKLVNNLLTIGITTLSTEALALAEVFHLERERIIKVLLEGGGRSAMLERKASEFISRQYPTQFSAALARKDLKLVEKAAAREGRTLKMTREARKLLEEAIAQGHAEDDFASVFEATLARTRQTPVKAPEHAAPSESGEPPASGSSPS